MTSRERVIAAIRFGQPDRIPVDLQVLPAAYMRYGKKIEELFKKYPIDFAYPKWNPEEMDPRYRAGRYEDEWGCIWENKTEGLFGMVAKHPLEDYKMLKVFKPPVDDIKNIVKNDSHREPDKFQMGFGADFFHRMCWLRGMDRVMVDLLDGRAELYELRDMVLEFFSRQVAAQAKTDVDGIAFADDFGSQRQLLISPELWRSFIKPVYQELFNICKKAGKFIFFHSDGYIVDIIEDLIEMGVDAINSQVWCMGLETLGDRFRGRITFWGEIDRQDMIPNGSPEDIRLAARKMKEFLAVDTGGLIGKAEVDGLTPRSNIEALLTAWNQS